MHGCVMENVRKIKVKLENIWIDLIRSIYAPYTCPSLHPPCAPVLAPQTTLAPLMPTPLEPSMFMPHVPSVHVCTPCAHAP